MNGMVQNAAFFSPLLVCVWQTQAHTHSPFLHIYKTENCSTVSWLSTACKRALHPTHRNIAIPHEGWEKVRGKGQWDRWKEQQGMRQMELPFLGDFLYIIGGVWQTRDQEWRRMGPRSLSESQTPTICYHGKLSVASLYYSAIKTSPHCKMLKINK